MSYSAVNKVDVNYETPTLTRVRSESKMGEVAVKASKRTDSNSVVTSIFLDENASRTAGLRRGQRVSLLRGTGKDKGKIRIVANKKGSLKIQESYNHPEFHLRIQSARLFDRKMNPRAARLTSYAKGAITLSV